jgi:hypothetical protein
MRRRASCSCPPSEPEPEPEPASKRAERRRTAPDRPLAVAGRHGLTAGACNAGGPVLLVDPRSGSTTARPRSSAGAYFEGTLLVEDFATPMPLPGKAKPRDRRGAAAVAPAMAGALMGGHGRLLPGHDPDGKYRLLKWPQTEREYPKHFRIATAMMKGPATIAEVAEASGVPQDEVADFVNANLATGYAELVPPAGQEPEPTAQKSAGGLFGRMRGR